MAQPFRGPLAALYAGQIDTAVATYLVVLSVIGAVGWLTTIWAVNAGKRWARPAATVLLVLGISTGLAGLLSKDTSGATGLGWAGTIPCLTAILAVALLWTTRRPA